MLKFDHRFVKESLIVSEGTFDDTFTNGKVKIIQEGLNRSKKRLYTKEAIQNDINKFEGLKMYVNHEDDQTTIKRGARDLKDWVATIKTTEATTDSEGKVSGFGNIVVHSPWFKDLLKSAKESGVMQHLGASINAFCKGSRQKVEDKWVNVIEGFPVPVSVDFVSEAGAGGKVLNFQESYYDDDERSSDMKWNEATAEEIKESANPEEIKKIEEAAIKTAKEAWEKEAKEKAEKDQADDKKKESDDKTGTEDESEAKFNVREARLDRKELITDIVNASSLPANAKERMRESLYNSEVIMKTDKLDIDKTKESISKAIEAEEAYLKEIREAKVSGNGGEQKEEDEAEKLMEAATSAFDSFSGIEKTKEGGKD